MQFDYSNSHASGKLTYQNSPRPTTPAYPESTPSQKACEQEEQPVAKYIAPNRRRNLLEQENVSGRKQFTSWNDSNSYNSNTTDRFGSYRSRNNNSQYSNNSSQANRVVNDRWKSFDEGPKQNKYQYPGKYQNQNLGVRSRESVTGTMWDIRDGRRWRPEKPEDIFKRDKDKMVGINFHSYDSIPVECTGRNSDTIEPLKSFRETAGIHRLLAENIERVQYEKPTPVQKYSIPVILLGRDLMACAQTGSGKTAAFLFPIITRMLNSGPPRLPACNNRYRMRLPAFPVTLMLSPTRELAVQIFEESKKFAFNTGIRTIVLYGGSELKNQIMMLEGGCDICVATPGRLGDLMKRDKIDFSLVKYLVLDEADRMLDMGFAPQIYSIVVQSEMPTSAEGRQTVMFSATFPQQIQKLASEFLNDYIFLTVGRVGATNDFITQNLIYANENAKPNRLLNIISECKGGLMLVFVETKKKADLIENFLIQVGLDAVAIHGDKTQYDRERALSLFRTGEKPILVATDVAARGLDIHNIEHVVNCDLPSRIDDYVHRIGRTGRAGNRGIATSFVNEKDKPVLRDLLGLLESARQEVPAWFHDMVRSCTSAHRSFNYVGKSSYGKGPAMRGSRQGSFLSRDVRGGDRSNAFVGSALNQRRPNSPMSNYSRVNDQQRRHIDTPYNKNDDEEDGW